MWRKEDSSKKLQEKGDKMLLKLTPVQYDKLKNNSLHYEVDCRYSEKENMYEVECEGKAATEIKKIVDN
jgi:hypothetical protein